jgi:hypothetical protein
LEAYNAHTTLQSANTLQYAQPTSKQARTVWVKSALISAMQNIYLSKTLLWHKNSWSAAGSETEQQQVPIKPSLTKAKIKRKWQKRKKNK